MPRQKLPPAAEMARFAAEWSRRFGDEAPLPDPLPTRGPALDQLKARYQGWAAVQWIEQHGKPVDPEAVASLLSTPRVRAGNSADKRLWRGRILYVTPLQAHYRLPSKV